MPLSGSGNVAQAQCSRDEELVPVGAVDQMDVRQQRTTSAMQQDISRLLRSLGRGEGVRRQDHPSRHEIPGWTLRCQFTDGVGCRVNSSKRPRSASIYASEPRTTNRNASNP